MTSPQYRPLKICARPRTAVDFICPVDGAVSQFGAIDNGHIAQATGHRFTTTELVGGDTAFGSSVRRLNRNVCHA
ncbi:MAG: phosphatidylserine decarboxylase [Sphingomonas bacterium]